jgi:CPA2 family monovalent cation:H+ antiporter-2
MANTHTFLSSLAVVFSVAALTSVVSRKARLPGIFGYLLAGLIVGPYTPIPLLADQEVVLAISELGVILLMFSLGLEFSPRRVIAIGSTAGLPALAETSLMFGLGFTVASLAGWSPTERLFTGAIVSISSTTVIARTFAEHPVASRLRELVFGILIVEDLIAILLIAALSTIAAGSGLSGPALFTTLVRLVTFLVILVAVGRLVIPRFMRLTLRLQSTETTAVVAVGIAFGAALLASRLGYSVALGAFIAGSLVAEGDAAHVVEATIAPVRDIFVAVFFVSAGMLIDPAAIVAHWGAVVALTLVVILGKLVAVSIGTFLTGQPLQVSVQAGMSLAQIGEFSFILATVGLAQGATRPFLYPVAIAVSAITTLVTPWLVRRAADVARHVDRRLPRPLQTMVTLYASWLPRAMRTEGAERDRSLRRPALLLLLDVALLAGLLVAAALEMDRLAPFVSRTLGVAALWGRVVVIALAAFAAVPLLAGVIRLSRRIAELISWRSLPAAAAHTLDRAAAPRRAFTSTLQFGILLGSALPLVAILQPLAPSFPALAFLALLMGAALVIVWRNANALYGHARAGAEVILLTLTQHDRAHASEREVASTMSQLSQMLPGLGDPVLIRLAPSDGAVGRTLRELDLRGRTGAMILAIQREHAEGKELITPDGGVHLLAGDCVAVAGAPDAVEAARGLLCGPPPVLST